jgi:hypothetical protein
MLLARSATSGLPGEVHATTPATDAARQPVHAAVRGPHAASTGDDDDEVSEVGSFAAETWQPRRRVGSQPGPQSLPHAVAIRSVGRESGDPRPEDPKHQPFGHLSTPLPRKPPPRLGS